MFSPLENESLDAWFQRLNAPLKRLPAEERVQIHQEVRQHLDALAAANEELGSTPEEAWEHALTQFGEPEKFGKRMAWEWRRGQRRLSPDMAAFVCGARTQFILLTGGVALEFFRDVLNYCGFNVPSTSGLLTYGCFIGVPAVTGYVIGRRWPNVALRGALTTALALTLLPLGICSIIVLGCGGADIAESLLGWLPLTCGSAYFASVTKRGWYRPTLNDFKLTLPRRRA